MLIVFLLLGQTCPIIPPIGPRVKPLELGPSPSGHTKARRFERLRAGLLRLSFC